MSVDERWETFLHDQISDLEHGPSRWVRMTALRPRLYLRGLSEGAQNHHLNRLRRAGRLALEPDSDRMRLSDADHAAAVRVDGTACHFVKWEPTTEGDLVHGQSCPQCQAAGTVVYNGTYWCTRCGWAMAEGRECARIVTAYLRQRRDDYQELGDADGVRRMVSALQDSAAVISH